MPKPLIFFAAGTVISFLFNHFLLGTLGWAADLFHAAAFGLGWALAYYVDRPDWPLSRKMGISFIGAAILLIAGLLIFNLDIAVPAIIKFSTVFVAYYLAASFRNTKSLRK